MYKRQNHDDQYHGILIQLPLPIHLDAQKILWSIDPKKDVDGFHPENAGLLAIGQPRYIPCTPKGIIKILEYENICQLLKEFHGKCPVMIEYHSNNASGNIPLKSEYDVSLHRDLLDTLDEKLGQGKYKIQY